VREHDVRTLFLRQGGLAVPVLVGFRESGFDPASPDAECPDFVRLGVALQRVFACGVNTQVWPWELTMIELMLTMRP
jgi:hypothetical protein